jgi:hypothetical protein
VSTEPTDLLAPRIDGRITDYFEWLAAGAVDLTVSGTMHAASHVFSLLLYGYDREFLYLRLDPVEGFSLTEDVRGELELFLATGDDWVIHLDAHRQSLDIFPKGSAVAVGHGRAAWDRIIEMAVPLAPLAATPGAPLTISFRLMAAGREVGSWPAKGPATIIYRGAGLNAEEWFV